MCDKRCVLASLVDKAGIKLLLGLSTWGPPRGLFWVLSLTPLNQLFFSYNNLAKLNLLLTRDVFWVKLWEMDQTLLRVTRDVF